MQKTFNLKLNKKDYDLCVKYSFYFEKNFEQMVKDVANEIRKYEKENKT